MVLGQSVGSLVRMPRNALCAGDVHKSVVARAMSRLRERADSLQLLFWMEEALIPAGDIVVHLDAKYAARLCPANNLLGVAGLQAVRPDANGMRPILLLWVWFVLGWGRRHCQGERQEKDCHETTLNC